MIIGLRQKDSDLSANWQHLSTFAGGMFGLGSQLLARKQDLPTAAALTEAAIYAYQSTATGLMPEICQLCQDCGSCHFTDSRVLQ